MFPDAAIPIWFMTFKFLEELQHFFFKLSSSHVLPVDLSRGSGPSWSQRDITLRRGNKGAGGMVLERAERSTQNVLNQILAPGSNGPTTLLGPAAATRRPNSWLKTATCQDIWLHLESYFTTTERFPLDSQLMIVLFTCYSKKMSTKSGCSSRQCYSV